MLIRRFGEHQSKTLPMGLFFLSNFPGFVNESMPVETTPLTTNHNCVNT